MVVLPLIMVCLMEPALAPDPIGSESAVSLLDYAPCGLISLHLVCRMRGLPVNFEELKQLAGRAGPDGSYSFEQLSAAATRLGMRPLGLQVGPGALSILPMPAIVQVHNPARLDLPPHLLVLLRSESDGVTLLDAPFPANVLPHSKFREYWTGNVLIFARDEAEVQWIRSVAHTQRGLSGVLKAWQIAGGAIPLALVLFLGLRAISKWQSARIRLGFAGQAVSRFGFLFSLSVGLSTLLLLSFVWHKFQVHTSAACLIDKELIDLGEVTPGAHTVQVALSNGGDQPLKISAINSSCTCAVVKYPPVVEARRRGMIDVQINVSSGPRSARLQVASNDPAGLKSVVILWHGEAKPLVVPRSIESPPVPVDQAYERTIRIVYPGGKPALVPRLQRFECDSQLVDVREGRNDVVARTFAKAGLVTNVLGELELRLRVQAPPKPGRLRARCKLFLGYGKSTIPLDLPIAVPFTTGPLTPDVTSITFSSARLKDLKGQERLVEVTDRVAGGDLLVEDVPDWLECKVLSRSGNRFLLRFRLADRVPSPFVCQTVHFVRAKDARCKVPFPVYVLAAQS